MPNHYPIASPSLKVKSNEVPTCPSCQGDGCRSCLGTGLTSADFTPILSGLEDLGSHLLPVPSFEPTGTKLSNHYFYNHG